MPTPAFLSIEGATQGNITEGAFTQESVGNVYQEGHENEILVEAFSHTVTVPTDPQSGQPTGQRVHKPLTITKVFDKSSPMLYKALSSGERLPKCEIKWWRTSSQGVQEHYFTTKLEDAIITTISARMPNCQDPSQAHFTHLEDVSFSYRKITWTHEIGSTTGEDDWRAPVK
ncbi:MAG TPA: Hcp family type VI secretion system effector [Desulfatiglandales bacterium]|nr:Hcp family type VI secretion system effector [Desulfatiglandales bacterium]